MADVKFVLKEPNSKEKTLIYLLFRFNNQRIKYSIGEKINPRFWNPIKQRAKETRFYSQFASLNTKLDNLTNKVKNAYRDLVNVKKIPTPQKIKNELDKDLFEGAYAQKTGFIKFIDDLIKSSPRKFSTLKQWKQTLRKLLEYKKATNNEVDFDNINLDFYNSFVNFLSKESYSKNSIGGFIKNVKIFMNEAVDRKLTNNMEYRNRKFKAIEEQVDKIYLSEVELLQIYSLDLSNNARLEKVRDLFIVASYTGLRFSDLIQVRKENFINNNKQIKVRTEKTGEIVIIPIHKFVKEIFSKYNGSLPEAISNQKMNDYLKEISKMAEIETVVKTAITRGGKIDHEVNKKFELVTTHTARRSFATNAYLKDMPTISIMKFTGHRTEKSFK
ncbi:MAG: site-specific integrase [Bacteroidota bacterium]|nr:site-specific integrase [Bacteroidota bacterium]